jgi:5-dehydro-2-deoxygluconokinase
MLDRLRLNRFVVLGRVGLDLYADPPGTRVEAATRYVAAIGGSAGNIAVALARQGAGAALLSCVSDDAVGRYCLTELQR